MGSSRCHISYSNNCTNPVHMWINVEPARAIAKNETHRHSPNFRSRVTHYQTNKHRSILEECTAHFFTGFLALGHFRMRPITLFRLRGRNLTQKRKKCTRSPFVFSCSEQPSCSVYSCTTGSVSKKRSVVEWRCWQCTRECEPSRPSVHCLFFMAAHNIVSRLSQLFLANITASRDVSLSMGWGDYCALYRVLSHPLVPRHPVVGIGRTLQWVRICWFSSCEAQRPQKSEGRYQPTGHTGACD